MVMTRDSFQAVFKAPLPPPPRVADPRERPAGHPPLPKGASKKQESSSMDKPAPKPRSKSPETATTEKKARDPTEFARLGSVKLIGMFYYQSRTLFLTTLEMQGIIFGGFQTGQCLLITSTFYVLTLVEKGFVCNRGT